MKIKTLIIVSFAVIAMCSFALDSVEVTDVKARQRYPWNGIVDIDFKLDSIPTEPYQMKVEVYDNVGKTNLPVKSAWTEGVSMKDNPCMVRTDTRRILWDAAADLPNGFKCTNVLVTCRDERLEDDPKRYMIIDLSAGSTATSYPVTYTNCPPVGGWTEEYKRSKVVLRKISPGRFFMGSQASDTERNLNESYHEVELTHGYYMSVFKITSAQYAMVCGGTCGDIVYAQKTWMDWRGYDTKNEEFLDNTTYTGTYGVTIRDTYVRTKQKKTASSYCYPNSTSVDSSSFVGKIRARTNHDFDLPTEAQWEFACRSGAITALSIGLSNSTDNALLIRGERYVPTRDGNNKVYVGNYMPNAKGLFDMNNNAGEWCLDVYEENLGLSFVQDPKGGCVKYEEIVISLGDKKTTWNYIEYFTYNGSEYCFGNTTRTWLITHVGLGVPRTIRGHSARISERTSAISLNTTGESFVTGIGLHDGTTYKAKYANPQYAIRLTLTVDE